MSKLNPIKIGLVGYGRAGKCLHVEPLLQRADFKIVAICDVLKDRRLLAAAHAGCKTYTKIEDLIADPEVELVDIAHRSHLHAADTMKALRAKKHVFLEKPMATTVADAKKLKAMSDRGPAKLFVRLNRRLDPDFLHVREIMKSGILGDIYQVRLNRDCFVTRDDWQSLLVFGGGQCTNWGSHIIDHALQMLDSPIKQMWTNLKLIAACGDAEDFVRVLLVGKNDRIVDMQIDGGAAIVQPEFVVNGTRGSLTCDTQTIKMRYLAPNSNLEKHTSKPGNPPDDWRVGKDLNWCEETLAVNPKVQPDMWAALYDSIRKRKKFPVTLDEAIAGVRIMELARKGTQFTKPKLFLDYKLHD